VSKDPSSHELGKQIEVYYKFKTMNQNNLRNIILPPRCFNSRFYSTSTKNKHLLNVDPALFSSFLMEVVTGVILSDGSLIKKYKNGGTYLKFSQSVIHTGYFMVVFNLFANHGLCSMTVPSVCIAKVKGKSYQYITFNTKSLTE